MQGVLVNNILEARNMGDLKYIKQLFKNHPMFDDISEYVIKEIQNTAESYEEGKSVRTTISNNELKIGFNEWQNVKRYLINYIIANESFIDKVETVYHLSKNELYESVFGKFFDNKHYIKLIHDSIDYNSLLTKINISKSKLLGKSIASGLYVINGIPKSGKQLLQLFLMDILIKGKDNILNINCGERPDTILQINYPEYYKKYKNNINERILSSDILTLINSIAKTKSKYIIINSINSIIDNNSTGVITKGGLDRNAMELISRIINYCALEFNKIVIAVYRSQPSDDREQIKSIFSGISNGIISLPNSKHTSGNFDDNVHFDNRTSGEFDEESVVITLNEVKQLLDPLLIKI